MAALEFMTEFSENVSRYCADREFSLLGPPGDRHGCWEICLHRFSEGLQRYVVIDLAEEDLTDSWWPFAAEIEFWAVADDGLRFARILGASRRLEPFLLREPAMESAIFRTELDRTMELAIGFASEDLDQHVGRPPGTRNQID